MSKKFLVIFLFIFLLCGCKAKKDFENGYAIVYKDNTPYLLNKANELYDLSEYDYISNTFGEYIVVGKYKNKKLEYGYINNSGDEIIKPQYEQAYPFSEGRAVVVEKNQYHIIDNDNSILYTLPNGYSSYSSFTDGFLMVEKDGKYTFLNNNYEICPISFDSVENFNNGYALVINNNNNQLEYNFIDINFNLIFNDELKAYDFVDSFYDGYARVGRFYNNEYYYSYINPKGEKLADEYGIQDFLIAENFSNNHALCYNGIYYDKVGNKFRYSPRFINNNGKYYEYNDFYALNLSVVDQNNNCGTEILSDFYFKAQNKIFINNYLVVKHNDEGAGYSSLFKINEFIDLKGNSFYDLEKVKLIYDNKELSQFELGQYTSPYDMKLPVITKFYEPGVETILTIVRIYSDKFAIVDANGNYILEAIYDNIIM